MNEASENQTSNLRTALEQIVKTYVIHDAQSRIIAAYEARTDARPGDPCMATRYAYRVSSGISSQVRMQKEYNAKWDPDDQGWDNALNTSPLPSPLVDIDL